MSKSQSDYNRSYRADKKQINFYLTLEKYEKLKQIAKDANMELIPFIRFYLDFIIENPPV